VQQHQRQQTSGLGLVGQKLDHQAAQPDGLGGQIATNRGHAAGSGVAFVEHQVDHLEDRGQPLAELLAGFLLYLNYAVGEWGWHPFRLPAECIDGDLGTTHPDRCPSGEDGSAAVIDVDDNDRADDPASGLVTHPEDDYIERNGPAPTFRIWTGPTYQFRGISRLAPFSAVWPSLRMMTRATTGCLPAAVGLPVLLALLSCNDGGAKGAVVDSGTAEGALDRHADSATAEVAVDRGAAEVIAGDGVADASTSPSDGPSIDAVADLSSSGTDVTVDAMADTPSLDPRSACAVPPAALARGPYPDDVLVRAVRPGIFALAKVLAVPGTGAPTEGRFETVDIQSEAVLVSNRLPGKGGPIEPPPSGRPYTLQLDRGSAPGVGSRWYFFLDHDYYLKPQRELFLEKRRDWRMPAEGYPNLLETIGAMRAFLESRPVFRETLVTAARIFEATVTSTTLERSFRCSTREYSVEVRPTRTLCGPLTGDLKILVPAHTIDGCDGYPSDQGPAPQLTAGQSAILIIRQSRDVPAYVVYEADRLVLWNATDVRPVPDWQALEDLRTKADR
jgi:hypothetical protein